MIYKTCKTYDYKVFKRKQWHRWFAWFPVTVHEYANGCKRKVWWQYVMRKGTLTCSMDGDWWKWEYKLYSEDQCYYEISD